MFSFESHWRFKTPQRFPPPQRVCQVLVTDFIHEKLLKHNNNGKREHTLHTVAVQAVGYRGDDRVILSRFLSVFLVGFAISREPKI